MEHKKEFDKLFKTYYIPLRTFAMQYITDADDAADIVTATFEDLWTNFADVDATTVKAWLYVSVRNHCIDTLRRRKCHEQYIEFVTLMSGEQMTEEVDFDAAYKKQLVENIFNVLQPPTSDILRACYVEGKKYKEVAENMDISVSTVKKHIIKALKTIREIRKNLKSRD